MATLHLMVGLPCAGKTTLARRLERDLTRDAGRPCLRLTPDDWLARLLGPDPDARRLDAARDPIEALLWDVAANALRLGGDVILDFGFWSRAERDAMRARAAGLGAHCVVHFRPVPEVELLRRLRERNARLPADCFRVDEAQLRAWAAQFEPPDAAELERP